MYRMKNESLCRLPSSLLKAHQSRIYCNSFNFLKKAYVFILLKYTCFLVSCRAAERVMHALAGPGCGVRCFVQHMLYPKAWTVRGVDARSSGV